MKKDSYIRLALMFGENQAKTFNKNLEKMIKLILFNNNYGMTINMIIEELKKEYSLDFSDSDIINVLTNKKASNIVCCEKDDSALNTYSITPAEKEKLSKRINKNLIKEFSIKFIKEFNIPNKEQEIEELLKKYFYSLFNSNADTMLTLFRSNKRLPEINDDFSTREKEIINNFIEWENNDKNKFIYEMVSCCFDYCMMTIKKDKNVFQALFNNKVFYLDSNIIFRIVGLNKESRKRTTKSFIEKCKDINIQLKYTNHTKKEIENTIDYHVDNIRKQLRDCSPISRKAMSIMDSKYLNLDFYDSYVNWCSKPTHKQNDYNNFNNDLKRDIYKELQCFKMETFKSFETDKTSGFNEDCDSYKNYKISKHKYYQIDEPIKSDINNYIYVEKKNLNNSCDNFIDTPYFIISADHSFCDWDRIRRPGAIPIVVLPSVWYSLILQYTGRTTDDDYASFSKFLNFSIIENHGIEDSRKEEILKEVLELEESNEIKEGIIFDIEKKLQKEYKDIDANLIVEKSYNYITNNKIREEVEKAKAKQNEIYEKEKKQLIELKENEINEAKLNGEMNIINQEIERITHNRYIAYWIITIFGVIALLALLFIFGYYIYKNHSIAENESINLVISFSIPTIITTLVGFVLKELIFNKILCSLDKDSIKKRVENKVKRRYRSI